MKKGLVLFFFIFFSLQTVNAGNFPIQINDMSGFDAPWPLIVSLPFAEREIKDPLAIRIIDSKGKEIPCQVDVTAIWKDGSIRWALAGLTASPKGKYRVEYGDGVKRATYPRPLKVTRQNDGSFTVDTGAAIYRFDNDKLLPEEGWLLSEKGKIQILKGSGAGAYVIDNSGRMAKVAGNQSAIENKILKEGPGRCVVRREGWYITDNGEKIARAKTWFYFAAGSPFLKITHSLILTEDTNKVWFKDYGLEFKTSSNPKKVYCATGELGSEDIKTFDCTGREIFMLQDQYPHFAERDSRAVIGSLEKGSDRIMEEFVKAGDWAYANYGNGTSVALVMPWLAERFPKEISFGERGARGVFWSARSGRELDFRTGTLARDYWKSWAEKGLGTPGLEKLSRIPDNAQATAHTHELWVLPSLTGEGIPELVKCAARAAARVPLAMAEPARLCATEAMGFPMYHKDTEKFPKEEAFISDAWDRFMVPYKVFPMTGFINWGHCPYLSYHLIDGRWFASFVAYGNMNDYNTRRNVWHLFARSGERRYYEYGHACNRIVGDFGIAHWQAPDKPKGSFTRTVPPIHFLPLYWGNTHLKFDMGNCSSEVGQWLLEYYLTGNEQSRELTVDIGESIKRLWNLEEALDWDKTLSFVALRQLSILYMREWDEDFHRMAKDLAHALINLDAQTGVNSEYMSYRDPMYKDQRHTLDLYFYYKATGDELGKQAFLKILDHRYRFNRNEEALSYFNTNAFTYSIAYWITGKEVYRTIAEETLRDSIASFTSTLEEDMKKMDPNPYKWKILPRLENPVQTHPFLGMPTVLKLVAEKGLSQHRFPVLIKNNDLTSADILFSHVKGQETVLNIYYSTKNRGNVKPSIFLYPTQEKKLPIDGIITEVEERIPSVVNATLNRPVSNTYYYNAKVTVPVNLQSGLYLASLETDDPFTVLDTNAQKIALYCPEGFWSATSFDSRLGMNKPFFFNVPENLQNLEIFLASPQQICSSDGTVIVERNEKNTGKMSIPVKDHNGFWSINVPANYPSAFAKLLNIEPVVTYRCSENFPEGTTGKPVLFPPAVSQPTADMEFLSGISGNALRLTGKRTIKFPRGEEIGDKNYTFFPGLEGTIEFWYRPDWSTQDIILGAKDSFKTRSFLEGPHIHLGYRYGVRVGRSLYFSDLILELLGTFPGAEPFRAFLQAKSLIGREEHHTFKAGRWDHIAYTWAYQPPEKALPDKPILGDLKWPSRWRVFGPLDRDDPVLPEEVLNSYPETLKINGKEFSAKEYYIYNTRCDFPGLLQNEPSGKTAYVFLLLDSPKEQEVTLGMGADWWMQAWINGKLVHDTTKTSNKYYPFSIWNHMVNVKLNKGQNILAVRFIRGGGSVLALGGPRELKTPDPASLKWEFTMFVNGKRLDEYRDVTKDRFLRSPGDPLQRWQSKCEVFNLASENREIVIGPLDGTIDILRISDIVRYRENFTPTKQQPSVDKNTKALFLFDGNLQGISAFSKETLQAQ